ncbi:DUF5687 family protein [Parabacteroides sp. OttesenSCG-928-N08]|nr:DUF5687 family protein [Parabacteroides sp. OttesenSCG-928-N08]
MIERELQRHQWKAFLRHPMYEKNLSLKIFVFFIFGILALQLLSVSFFLNEVLEETGPYSYAIYNFNTALLFIFLVDFLIKYLAKQNNSMQIAPYLALPIKRNKLFNFLLVKEFSNIWNLYLLFLLLPFSFKAILPFFGFGAVVCYLLFIYLLSVCNSLLVSVCNHLLNRNRWYFFLPIVAIAAIVGISFLPFVHIDNMTVKLGEWVLNYNPLVWIGLLFVLGGLWKTNQWFMRDAIYRELQGKKIAKASSFSHLSFLERFGEIGEFINLEIKLILRSKRLKQQIYFLVFFTIYMMFILYSGSSILSKQFPMLTFFCLFLIGGCGLCMTQYLFMSESSYFDGLMTRGYSILNLLKAKYLFYNSFSLFMLFILLVPVFHGKLTLLYLISVFFYATGFLMFLMFQNAVYNKTYFDLFDGGMFNWKGTSGNMLVVTMLGMFIPVVLVAIISSVFSNDVACYFMLIVGLLFTFTSNYWLKWTYNRFMKRRHRNMEGFRSNA